MTNVYKLMLLGVVGVGKSALTIQMVSQHFVEDYDPTVEDSYRKRVLVDGDASLMEILDTSGDPEYEAMRDRWVRVSEAFVFVYSITSKVTFDSLDKFAQQVRRIKDLGDDDAIPGILVGNKNDLESNREVPIAMGMDLARQLRVEFLESSAKNRVNVEEAFCGAARVLKRMRGQTTNQKSNNKKKRCNLM